MWTFDGETWIEEGGSPSEVKRPDEAPRPELYGGFYPELQVIEIVPVPLPRTNYVPPLPLP